MTQKNSLVIGVQNGFKPDPRLTVDEWSDKFRILTSEASAEAGRWRTDRTPYLREIMQVMSPTDPTQQVKVIKGTQLGFSSIADNIAMCYLDLYPCPILYILPTETLAKGTSKRRLTPSIRAIPHLAKKITGGKSKSDIGEVFSKAVAGGNLSLGWSNSTASFRSFSARVVILDDVDGYGSFGEGDVMELGKARADAFANKKIYINSTPTIKGQSNIDVEFKESDQREFFMPCPECDEYINFVWDNMVYERDKQGRLVGDVMYSCKHCGSLIPEYKKTTMMLHGKWIPQNEGHHHKGYKLSSLYSPLGWLSWNEIASEFIKAYELMKIGDNSAMQVWQNTRNAQVWEDSLDGVDIKDAHERVEDYGCEVPDEVYILTAGVDTQDDRFEIEVLGHGKNGETWSIDYKVIAGDPQFPDTQADLDKYLDTIFTRCDGRTMRISGTAIDSGGHRTEAIYDYAKQRTNKKIFAIKGSGAFNAPIVNKTVNNIVPNQLTLFILNVVILKDDFFANLGINKAGANYCHFPNKPIYNDKYFRMLTAEKRDENGKYVKIRLRNEALDVRIYALAVLHILGINVNSLPKHVIYSGEIEIDFTPKVPKIDKNVVSMPNYLDDF
jgi:phage terminase large subunit GpA-like protein